MTADRVVNNRGQVSVTTHNNATDEEEELIQDKVTK